MTSTRLIDLRSDTVTLPSGPMRRAMAEADVGDDQYGEDPSVNRLQGEVAQLLGKEAALFLPSGTMANQVALRTLTRPGDDVLVPTDSHVVLHETGAGAANAGVQFSAVGADGLFGTDDVAAAIKPAGHIVYPPTTLLVIENTHNRAGGVVFPEPEAAAVCALARDHGLTTYCDGARLLNAAVAAGRPAAELAAPFDLVSLSLSKGLGAPSGSMLAGSREVIGRAHRYRRMLGGAMRQVGILAAAGTYALAHNVGRLAEDHANARRLAEHLGESELIGLDLERVQTNIVLFAVADANAFVAICRERGVLLNAFSPTLVRAVTHLNVDRDDCERAAAILLDVAPTASSVAAAAGAPTGSGRDE